MVKYPFDISDEATKYHFVKAFEMSAPLFTGHDGPVAIGNMDGTWWVDWDAIEPIARLNYEDRADAQGLILFARLLAAARGRLNEVSRERSEEIAKEYADRLNEKVSGG